MCKPLVLSSFFLLFSYPFLIILIRIYETTIKKYRANSVLINQQTKYEHPYVAFSAQGSSAFKLPYPLAPKAATAPSSQSPLDGHA